MKIQIIFLIVYLLIPSLYAQTEQIEKNEVPNILSDISGQWFLAYRHSKSAREFILKRGYLTVQKKFTEQFSGRITPDITVDREGDGKGDVEMRLKYLYLKYNLPRFFFFNKSYMEFGLVQRPWIDFEEHINIYRVQGTMFLERYDIVNSGDYGITFVSLFGNELDENYRLSVNPYNAGRYGSMSLGIYNGGGYHAIEQNANKTIETRITLRPIPEIIPGLQLSYSGAYGKGNSTTEPEWNYHAPFISLEDARYVMTAMYYHGTGNYSGTAVDTTGKSNEQEGYALFMEYKILQSSLSLIGRYDQFMIKGVENIIHKRSLILGVAYNLFSGGKILFDYDRSTVQSFKEQKEEVLEIAVEIVY